MSDIVIKLNPRGLSEIERLEEDLALKLANEVKAEAKLLCPVASGKLRDSIDILDVDGKVVEIGTHDTGYGLYVEMDQSFMRAALDKVEIQGGH
jgi:hypothetical protein